MDSFHSKILPVGKDKGCLVAGSIFGWLSQAKAMQFRLDKFAIKHGKGGVDNIEEDEIQPEQD